MGITKKPFGTHPTGQQVTQYILINKKGESVSLIDYGAILTALHVRDRDDRLADVVTGFDTLEGYLKPHGSMGETIGRYGNRIAKGQFTLDGVTYQLAKNNGENHLHGGPTGFGSRMWEATPQPGNGFDRVTFHRISPDGEEGYPGTLDVSVTYTWDDESNLSIRYQATTDKPTLCNLTNHAYFNLAGHDRGTLADHEVTIFADTITKVDFSLIPTGDYMPVIGTPLDLRFGDILYDMADMAKDCPQMQYAAGGIDHNYVLNKGTTMGMCAMVHEETTGRQMIVYTDQPGVQFYTANTTDIQGGKGGARYGRHCAFCLETQHFPDSPNQPGFPSTVLRPGETYDTTTIYQFVAMEMEDFDEEEGDV